MYTECQPPHFDDVESPAHFWTLTPFWGRYRCWLVSVDQVRASPDRRRPPNPVMYGRLRAAVRARPDFGWPPGSASTSMRFELP